VTELANTWFILIDMWIDYFCFQQLVVALAIAAVTAEPEADADAQYYGLGK
jgi:hypothetical protein